jgi:hypothetical protein
MENDQSEKVEEQEDIKQPEEKCKMVILLFFLFLTKNSG